MVEPVWITLTGLRAVGHHGVYEHERRDGQEFVVDLRLEVAVDTSADQIEGTVHYGEVAEAVVADVTGSPVDLIETLAGRIADTCLAFEPVTTVEVVVHKPQAPITVAFDDVSVSLVRSRPLVRSKCEEQHEHPR
ncbi:dihydroneopterin aldolase [Aestuariimicrobium ganziense]|uniref:dihydroneopterin aldolase n=1 Tax=Aestuariimicrobium ganziense TaxID=2773677 RepID=UPI001944B67D|nr:dihydroneopterin aldolase [Aestuariimicrobium ganziense]